MPVQPKGKELELRARLSAVLLADAVAEKLAAETAAAAKIVAAAAEKEAQIEMMEYREGLLDMDLMALYQRAMETLVPCGMEEKKIQDAMVRFRFEWCTLPSHSNGSMLSHLDRFRRARSRGLHW